MTDKQKRVYKKLKKIDKPTHPRDLAKELGYSESAYIAQQLKALVRDGYIEKEGKGKFVTYKTIKQDDKQDSK